VVGLAVGADGLQSLVETPKEIDTMPELQFHDKIFYSGEPQVVDGKQYFPVTVSGIFGDPWFAAWPGIGPSPASFTMKAYADENGNIYRPDGPRDELRYGQLQRRGYSPEEITEYYVGRKRHTRKVRAEIPARCISRVVKKQ